MKKQILLTLWMIALAAMLLSLPMSSRAALTWSWQTVPPDPNIKANIISSITTAVGNYNRYANYDGNIVITYNPGVPTSQCDGFGGLIEFGNYINARVAEHEIAHWLGCGTYWAWSNFNGTGQWSGINAVLREKSYEGEDAVVYCDTQHFWPNGANQDGEGPSDRHIGMVGALRADMGLSDTTIGQASGWYRLQNRADGLMLDNMGITWNGAPVGQYPGGGSWNQKWVLTYKSGGKFVMYCAGDGLYLDTLGHTQDGSTIGQWPGSGSRSQQWQIVPTDPGYFKLINKANGKCLDTGGQTGWGMGMQNWYSNGSWNQQWKFMQ